MPKSVRFKWALALAAVALGSTSAAAQDYVGPGSYYAPPPSYSGFGPPADLNISPPRAIPPPAPPAAYGYGPPAAYGYGPPAAYGYAPPATYGYGPPAFYGYAPPAAFQRYQATPSYNPYYFGTRAWWNQRDREGLN
jgi:hypothetical protein